MTKSHFQKIAALWMFSWELSTISQGSSNFRKLNFKVATLNRALDSYFVSLLHWFFLLFRRTGDYCSVLLYNGMQKLFKIDHPSYSSQRKLCCSPLFLKNCEILEKICTKICETVSKEEATVRLCETLRNWVTHGETVRVETSQFALFT